MRPQSEPYSSTPAEDKQRHFCYKTYSSILPAACYRYILSSAVFDYGISLWEGDVRFSPLYTQIFQYITWTLHEQLNVLCW